MINQLEIPMYIEEALPEISESMILDMYVNAYKVMNDLSAFTCKNIQTHNYGVVKRCFILADQLYCKGNDAVKNAIENVFIYSFTNMLQLYKDDKKKILAIIPITLYSIYITQVQKAGC